VLPASPPQVGHYLNERGRSPFREWFGRLDSSARVRITTIVERLRHGHFSNVKPLGDGILEWRVDSGPGYRVYFAQDGDALVILSAGGTKRRQQDDIAAAKMYWADYKRRRTRGEGVWQPWH
jgi:putative addiction module killer protein